MELHDSSTFDSYIITRVGMDRLMLSGSSKDDDEISAVVALAAVHIANTKLGVIGAEDISGVRPAIHPPIEGTNRVG